MSAISLIDNLFLPAFIPRLYLMTFPDSTVDIVARYAMIHPDTRKDKEKEMDVNDIQYLSRLRGYWRPTTLFLERLHQDQIAVMTFTGSIEYCMGITIPDPRAFLSQNFVV